MLKSINALTHEAALTAATTALAKAKDMGVNISVSVLDVTGHELAMVSHSDAGAITVEIARAKARSALNFKRPTAAWAQVFENRPLAIHGLNKFDGVAVLGGGLPIEAKGGIVGAIGASGATSEQDADCCQAGIDAVLAKL